MMLKVSEDTIIPFSLELSSQHASIASNHLTLNYAHDIRMNAHILKCESYLARTLKISDVNTIDCLLRSSIVKGIPKHLQLWLRKSLLNFSGTAYQL